MRQSFNNDDNVGSKRTTLFESPKKKKNYQLINILNTCTVRVTSFGKQITLSSKSYKVNQESCFQAYPKSIVGSAAKKMRPKNGPVVS